MVSDTKPLKSSEYSYGACKRINVSKRYVKGLESFFAFTYAFIVPFLFETSQLLRLRRGYMVHCHERLASAVGSEQYS
jgi:hypothetical protein